MDGRGLAIFGTRDRYKMAFDFCAHCVEPFHIYEDQETLNKHIDNFSEIRRAYSAIPDGSPKLDRRWYPFSSFACFTGGFAKAVLPLSYVKKADDCWDGYNGESRVVVRDWTPDTPLDVCHRLKDWCAGSFRADVGGGQMRYISIRTLVVLSKHSMKECFGHDKEGLFDPLFQYMQIEPDRGGHVFHAEHNSKWWKTASID